MLHSKHLYFSGVKKKHAEGTKVKLFHSTVVVYLCVLMKISVTFLNAYIASFEKQDVLAFVMTCILNKHVIDVLSTFQLI